MVTYLMATLRAGHKPGVLRQRKLLAGAGSSENCLREQGDMVLNDGAPIGRRISDGKEYPIFNELQLLQPSNLHTWSVRVKNCKQKQIDKLLKLCKDAYIEAEDWSTLRWLCKQCSEGVLHEHHDEDLKAEDPLERCIGFASENKKAVEQVLMKWRVLTLHGHSKLTLELE